MLRFIDTYQTVGFLQRAAKALAPSNAELLLFNQEFAGELGVDPDFVRDRSRLAAALSGADLPSAANPQALAYAGHQFGNFVPQLGDGRALLIGEFLTPGGKHFDLQLKGSGPTVFSRGGDGLMQIGPALREYIMSEAMFHLGIPTTRSLSVVTTGDELARQYVAPGAVLARVARSHLRIGTFEYAAARHGVPALKSLISYSLDRHYPGDRPTSSSEQALLLLTKVAESSLVLVAKWLGVGFIHGVMNTDNVAIAGDTLDYGPCAFMDTFSRSRVFSSIDRHGRYAYGNQSRIMVWNLARLAEALLPVLIEEGISLNDAQESCNEILNSAAKKSHVEWLTVFRRKLGIFTTELDSDGVLIDDFLNLMEEHGLDFTNTFRSLSSTVMLHPSLALWLQRWYERLVLERADSSTINERLNSANPAVIPRNHRVEEAIAAAINGDLTPSQRLLSAIKTPFEISADNRDLANPPGDAEWSYKTFCGT